jgi:lysozyme
VGRNLTTQGISDKERFALSIRDEQLTKDGPGITTEQAMGLLDNDIKDRVHQLDVYIPWWRLLSPARQRVLINMAFREGSRGMLNDNPQFIAHLQRGRYEAAAQALEAAGWFQVLHKRGARLAALVRQG